MGDTGDKTDRSIMANDNLNSERSGEEPMEILGESDCWTLLRQVSVGRIAFPTADGGVNIFPVNHLVDGGSIVFRTGAGEKLTGATNAGEVVFEADGSDERSTLAWSVILKGHAEMITTATDLFESFELNVQPWHASRKPFFVRVIPTSTTGRRFKITHDS